MRSLMPQTKPLRTLLFGVCLMGSSCDRPSTVLRELAEAEENLRKNEASIHELEEKIRLAGGGDIEMRLQRECTQLNSRINLLESENASLLQKWNHIETELSVLKPASEVFKEKNKAALRP